MTKEDIEIPPPECCDMRGMLSFLILWLLAKRPMFGQELAEEISKRKAVKPNHGTIYPALKNLRIRDLIQSKKKGGVTTYHITEKGKNGPKKTSKYFCKAYGKIFQEQNCQ